MIRLRYLFSILITLFIFNVNVNALVDAGINGGDKNYLKKDAINYTGVVNYTGHVGSIYGLTGDSNALAFCIDPGLHAPDSYEYVRELNLNTSLDKEFYKAYIFYVNNITAGDDKDITKVNTDVVLRSILNKNNYVLYTSDATRDEQFFGNGGILDYIETESMNFNSINWSLGGNNQEKSYNCTYWTGTSNLDGCKAVLDNARNYYKSYKTFNITWDNPITITPSAEYTKVNDENDSYYTFKFEIKFSDGKYNFFDFYWYNNGYNMNAFFEYNVEKINDYYALDGNTIEYSNISKRIENDNTTQIVTIKMSESVYNTIYAEKGSVFIKLNYKYYHPLSHENIYVSSKVDTLKQSTTKQRMVVFDNYIHEDYVVVNKDILLDLPLVDYNVCSQNGNVFSYGGAEVDINEFESKCGCSNINVNFITNQNLKDIYINKCTLKMEEKVTSTLEDCTNESVVGKNQITHYYKKLIENNNNYCTLECTETINIDGYTDKFSTIAGQYFKLSSYPKLDSNKSCKVNVSYNKWKEEYVKLLEDEINATNKRLRDEAIRNARADGTGLCCNSVPCQIVTKYIYDYVEYSYNRNSNQIQKQMRRGSYTCNIPPTNSDSYNASVVNEKIGKINEHFDKLLRCNKYLYNQGENFYKFYGELSFNYEQTNSIVKNAGSNMSRISYYNSVKPNGEADDKMFEKIPKNDSNYINGYSEVYGTNYNNYNYDSYGYKYISNTSSTDAIISDKMIGTIQYVDYDINRSMNYSANYYPSVLKYVDSFTGTISSNKNNLNNPISLDKVYDTSILAIESNSNNNFYEFHSLGDNNNIFNYINKNGYIEKNGVTKIATKEDLKRLCTYGIKTELVTNVCNGNICNSKPNFVFRIVDSNNIDPNNRLNDDSGFKNWDNIKGETVKKTMESSDTFNPGNLEYSFTLDSNSIRKIRNYNNGCDENGKNCINPISYSNVDNHYSSLKCNENGNECVSAFIEELSKDTGLFGNKVASNIEGRNKWKYLDYNLSNGYYINVYKKDEVNYQALEDKLKNKGVEVTP